MTVLHLFKNRWEILFSLIIAVTMFAVAMIIAFALLRQTFIFVLPCAFCPG